MNAEAARAGYHHGELPETLMSLAIEHIAAHGTEKLSLRALAREAGVSPTAPYRHFPTKRCLLAALATQGFVRLREQTRAVVDSDLSVDDRFIGMGLAYLEFALQNPVAYQLMFGSILGDFSQYEMLRNASAACYEEVQRMLQQVIDDKGLTQNVDQLGGVVWSGVHGMASLLLNDRLQPATPDQEMSSPMRSVAALHADKESALRSMFANLVGDRA